LTPTSTVYGDGGPAQPASRLSYREGAIPIDLKIDDVTYTIHYRMTSGGSLDSVVAYKGPTSYTLGMAMATSPADGEIILIFPRPVYDRLLFTEPNIPFQGVDGNADVAVDFHSTCDEIFVNVPVKKGQERAKVVASYFPEEAKKLDHSPRLSVLKIINAEDASGNDIEFFTLIKTDAVRCDSTFMKDEKKIHLDIAGRAEDGAPEEGYFSISIPSALLGGNYTVLVDGRPVPFERRPFSDFGSTPFNTVYPDLHEKSSPDSTLIFSYPREARTVDIVGTAVIPEFGSTAAAVAVASIAFALIRLRTSKPQANAP
jgi:hypothetical protein